MAAAGSLSAKTRPLAVLAAYSPVVGSGPERRVTAGLRDPTLRLFWASFLIAILVQRLGLWVAGFPIAAALLILFGVVAIAIARGIATIVTVRLILWISLGITGTVSLIYNTESASLQSWLLFLALYAPFCIAVPLEAERFQRLQRGYAYIALGFGLAGIVQYLAQFVVPDPIRLFTWAWFMSPHLLIEYASVNRLGYLSPTFKSNAFFFLEASAVSQLLARTLLIGRYSGVGWLPVVLTLAGIAVTYSGGGMILLIFFLPFLVIVEARRRDAGLSATATYVIVGLFAALFISVAARSGLFQVDAITGRFDEITRPGSSGYARYGSSVLLIERALEDQGVAGLMFGRGPGSAITSGYSFETFTTAWVKLLIEYGILGLALFSAMLGYTLWSSSRSLFVSAVLFLAFMLLDGNLLVPQYVLFLFLLGALPMRKASL